MVPSYEDLSLPAVREYRALMDYTNPAPPPIADDDYRPLRYSFTSFEGFLNAKVMAYILDSYGETPNLGLNWAAESVRELDIGIDVLVSISPAKHQGLDRVYFTTVRDGKFVPIDEKQWAAWQN